MRHSAYPQRDRSFSAEQSKSGISIKLIPVIAMEKLLQRLHSPEIANLSQSLGSAMPDIAILIPEGSDERNDSFIAADAAKHDSAEIAHLFISIIKQPDKSGYSRRAEYDKHLHGTVAQIGIAIIADRLFKLIHTASYAPFP